MEESYCSSCGSEMSTSRKAKRSYVNANGLNNDDVSGSQSESKQIKMRNNSTGKWMTEIIQL